MRFRNVAPLTVLCVLAWCGSAAAHKVGIFAAVEGGVIKGEAYFSGGGRPQGVIVKFLDPEGSELGEARTDAEGRFAFTPHKAVDHHIVLTTEDGHRAEFVVKAAELGLGPAAAQQPAAPVEEGPGNAATGPSAAPLPDMDRRIAEAVAREVVPLRRQLDEMENRVRFRDILGSIGYIFGLAGVAMYFKARRTRTH